MTESTQLRKNEFIDMLEMNEAIFVDIGNCIHCTIPSIGKSTYYPKADKLNVHLENKWFENGFDRVKTALVSKTFEFTKKSSDLQNLNLRDQFAMAAMNGYLSASVDCIGHGMPIDAKNIAEQVYLIADAMMKQRKL